MLTWGHLLSTANTIEEDFERCKIVRRQIFNKVSSIVEVYENIKRFQNVFEEPHRLEKYLKIKHEDAMNSSLLDITKIFEEYGKSKDLSSKIIEEEERFFNEVICATKTISRDDLIKK